MSGEVEFTPSRRRLLRLLSGTFQGLKVSEIAASLEATESGVRADLDVLSRLGLAEIIEVDGTGFWFVGHGSSSP